MLERLRQTLAGRRARLRDLLDINDRDLSPDELREFDILTASADTEDQAVREGSIAWLEARVAQVEETDAREARLAAARSETPTDTAERTSDTHVARVTSEPETYRQGGDRSYFRDLVSV